MIKPIQCDMITPEKGRVFAVFRTPEWAASLPVTDRNHFGVGSSSVPVRINRSAALLDSALAAFRAQNRLHPRAQHPRARMQAGTVALVPPCPASAEGRRRVITKITVIVIMRGRARAAPPRAAASTGRSDDSRRL